MMRSLLLSGKSMLLVLCLACFGTSPLFAQPPDLEAVLTDQVPIAATPFIQFLGFNDNCASIDFRLGPGISQFYNFVLWSADNQPNQLLPANGIFKLTAPSTSVTAQRIDFSGFFFTFVGNPITLNTPPLSPFTVEADPTTVIICPLELGETTVTSNRCVGTTSWSSTIVPFFGAPANGIGIQLQNESAGFGFDPTSSVDVVIVPNTPLLLGATYVYLVEFMGTETLSGSQELENILVISFDDCADIPPGFQASDDLVADFARAADRSRGGAPPTEFDNQDLMNRLNDEIRRGGDLAKNLNTGNGNTLNLSTTSIAKDDDISVFPNPTSDFVTVSYRSTPVQLRMLDVTGRVVRDLQNTAVGLDQTTIQVSELKPGIYLLEAITAEGEREVRKVQIAR